MKRKWLIGLLSVFMVLAMCFGVVACGGDTEQDEETAQTVINQLNGWYLNASKDTPDDFQRLAQVRVGDTTYPVDWSANVKTQGYDNCVKVGTEKDATGKITIDITRVTVDVEYTLTATVKVNEVTKSASYEHRIPKKSAENSNTATLDFSEASNRTQFDAKNNLQVWSSNGITLTNTGSVGDYTKPVRLYKNTTVTIEMEGSNIIHIDFHSASAVGTSNYPDNLKTSLEASDLPIKGEISVSEDGLTFGVDFETPMESVTFKTTADQCRLTSIDVEGVVRTHTHHWTYEHIDGTWTHTATCTAEGCDVGTRTENCTPVLNECACGYTYTAKEIVDALFALQTGKSLPGTYTLTGKVTDVTELDTSKYYNVTFKMTVEGKELTVFRAKGDQYAEIAVGGTATVNGELLDYGGTKEFTQGGTIVSFTPGVDDRTPQQKVTAALAKVNVEYTVNAAGDYTLPTPTVDGVTFSWAKKSGNYELSADGKSLVIGTELPAEAADAVLTLTASYGTETVTGNTKDVTFHIKAKSTPAEGFNPLTAAPTQAGEYLIGMEAKGTWYYLTGGTDGQDFRLKVSSNASEAATFTVEPEGDGFVIKYGTKYLEIVKNGEYVNSLYRDSRTAECVWKWNATYNTLTVDITGTTNNKDGTYFLGSYNDYTSNMSASFVSNLTQENEYPSRLGTLAEVEDTRTAQQKVEAALEGVNASYNTSTAPDYALPTSSEEDVTFTWAAKEGTSLPSGFTLEGGTLKFAALPQEDTAVQLTVTATCGTETVTGNTKDVTINVKSQTTVDNTKTATYTPAYTADTEVTTETLDDITLTFTTGASSAAKYYTERTSDPAALRLYVGNLLTFKAAAGYKITKITFTFEATKDSTNAILASNGAYADGVWTGESSSVMLFIGGTGGQRRVLSIAVEYEVTTHVHQYGSFAHDANKMTHSATCSADGCYEQKLTQYCVAESNVCSGCTHTYSAADIKAALEGTRNFLLGTYSVTGEVTAIGTAYTDSKGVTFTVTVGDAAFTVYQYKGTDAANIMVGDTVTVNGRVEDYNGTLEFPSYGTTVTNRVEAGPDDKIAAAKAEIEAGRISVEKTYSAVNEEGVDLPTENHGATLAWAVKDAQDHVANVKIEGGKLKILALPTDADLTVTLIVTISCDGATQNNQTANYEITIKKVATTSPDDPELQDGFNPLTAAPTQAGEYLIGMDAKGTWYYLTGGTDGQDFRLKVSSNASEAATFTVEPEGDGFVIKYGTKYLEIVKNGEYVNSLYRDSRTAECVWKWNATYNTLTVDITGTTNNKDGTYFLGSYNDYTSNMSASFVSNLTKENEYPSRLGLYKAPAGGTTDPGTGGGSTTPTGDSIVYDFSASKVDASETAFGDTAAVLSFFQGVNNATELTSVDAFERAYPGNPNNSGAYVGKGCLKLGGSSKAGTVTLKFSKNVTKVVLNCQAWDSASSKIAKVNVNGEAASGTSANVGSGADITYNLAEATNTIQINSNKYVFVFSITVYFAE